MSGHRDADGLSAAVDRILREADPIGLIAMGAPDDEYAPELRTLLPRLNEASSPVEMQRIVHEEFVRWFGGSAGPASGYEAASRRIWEAWTRFGASR